MTPADPALAAVLLVAIAGVAALYASVGHGGASGFLAVLALFSIPVEPSASAALVLNVLVAGTAWWAFARAGHFSWRLTWPCLAGSMPAAMAAGALDVDPGAVRWVLAVSLAAAAALLVVRPAPPLGADADGPPTLAGGVAVGGILGFIAGLVGVGGGIFLSPVAVLRRWASPQRVAAMSAAFIVLNSIAGLAGRAARGTLDLSGAPPLLLAAGIGGWIGSRVGAGRSGARWQRPLLAAVLAIAAAKLTMQALRPAG